MKWLVAALVAIGTVAAIVFVSVRDTEEGQSAEFSAQGGDGVELTGGDGRIDRLDDGLWVHASVATPIPGSYEYPTGDMIVPGATPHPEVVVGGADEPEAFTMWAFVFNYPDLCTDDCNADDFAEDAPAKGGVFQVDARVGVDAEMSFAGSLRVGQVPATGSPLENPRGAEIHLAIAPHGKAIAGSDGWRQLNGSVGNPTLWWGASFLP